LPVPRVCEPTTHFEREADAATPDRRLFRFSIDTRPGVLYLRRLVVRGRLVGAGEQPAQHVLRGRIQANRSSGSYRR
jgi:hypothetical protein